MAAAFGEFSVGAVDRSVDLTEWEGWGAGWGGGSSIGSGATLGGGRGNGIDFSFVRICVAAPVPFANGFPLTLRPEDRVQTLPISGGWPRFFLYKVLYDGATQLYCVVFK